jgi:hypothetical protein
MKYVSALVAAAALTASAQAAVVGVGNSTAPWLGYMNVFDFGGNFQFGSGWGVGDLRTQFDDGASTLTLLPNSIGDPNPYWYTPFGGPGSTGNKIMEANLYQEVLGGGLGGQTVTFNGTVLSNSFTSAHTVTAFIRDFAGDFSSVVESSVVLSGPGAFSLSLNTINDSSRVVQWGLQVKGVNVWISDIAPFGNMVIATPTPGALGVLGLAGIVAGRRRR